jgi:hypothetical protein
MIDDGKEGGAMERDEKEKTSLDMVNEIHQKKAEREEREWQKLSLRTFYRQMKLRFQEWERLQLNKWRHQWDSHHHA